MYGNNALLIIGNGFDLNCGLKSSYLDYYRHLLKTNKWLKESIDKLLEAKEKDDIRASELKNLFHINENFTIWDLIFILYDWATNRLETEQTWQDIESIINYAVFNLLDKTERELRYSDKEKEIIKAINNSEIIPEIISDCIKTNGLEEIAKYNFVDYMESELKRFCSLFSKYIEKEVRNHNDYEERAIELANKISPDYCFDILSFNYTSPFHNGSSGVANIHGLSSKEQIVFGICVDGKNQQEIIHHSNKKVFTKEYQTLELMAKDITVSLPNTIYQYVYVFGLSLSGQDYNFFENLFDRHNVLGDCKTIFIFAFTIYDKKKEKEIIKQYQNGVYELICKYGDKHDCSNLVGSLINKGFLIIKTI